MTLEPVVAASDITYVVRPPGAEPIQLLTGISLRIYPGDSVAIQGRSGSGKTSLLSIIGLLTRPTGGHVRVLGRDVGSMSDAQRSQLRNEAFGFVFQNYSLARHMTARQNIELALRYSRYRPRRQRRDMVNAVLELVALEGRGRAYPRHLSGGEQQRVALARALVLSPPAILADEPTGSLDTETGGPIMDLLLHAMPSRGAALVIVTHDSAVATRAKRQLWLHDGQLTERAPTA